jgi:protoporphyrinogen IX oxidase
MASLYLKSLHIIFVTTWFAGLFYIVRLFIYDREAQDKDPSEKKILTDQYKIMQKRLWYGITWPSCILTIIFGLSLIHDFLPLSDEPWLIAKLFFVFLLFLYHLSCGHILKSFAAGNYKYTSMQLRIWNEVATIFLVSIVFLVKLKEIIGLWYGLGGLFSLMIILGLGIKIYRKKRLKSEKNNE